MKTTTRKVVAQCCASSVTDLLVFTNGLSIGFSALLIPELYKSNAEISVSLAELTWISCMCQLMMPVGSCVSGPLSVRVGRRLLIFLAAFLYIFNWSLFYWASDFWTLLLGFGLLGITGGIVNAATLFYTMEIGEPTMRGFFVAKTSCCWCLGFFTQVLTGNYLHWRTLTLTTISVPVLAFIGSFLVPESPIWLASKGRLLELKSSLRWLRGWTSSSNVQIEYDELLDHLSRSKIESASRQRQSFAKVYLRRGVLAPLRLVIFVFVLDSINGCSVLISYAVLVFRMLNSPLNEYTAATILAALQILGTLLLMSLIRRVGKRPPTIVSLAVASLGFLGVAGCVLITGEQESDFSWIPTVLIFISMFALVAGVSNTPWFFAGELFPIEVRSLAIGIAVALYYIFIGLANKSFLYVLDALSVSGTFFLFSATNLIGFIVMYRYMPETEGKTLAEIEEFFVKKEKSNADGTGSSDAEFS